MADTPEAPDPFPIVAVGASAGGLAPTTDLLRHLGSNPGLGLVVIHHLDPTHESHLVEILSRATPLPVLVATGGLRVEVNHVYVIPPNTDLLIVNGVLKLVPRVEERGLHLPINLFFESLALDHGGLAVGVVLSGTGLDGAEGVKAIEREGGITLAQDATAKYDSMPRGAVATGCVDLILPPAGIARELIRLGAQAPAMREGPLSAADERAYAQILAAMRRASGVDFSSYKQTTIGRRLDRRLFLHGLTDLSTYLELLKRDPEEIGALCAEALRARAGYPRERQHPARGECALGQRSSGRRGGMRVLLADDHRIVREGLRALLEKAGVQVVGEAGNGHEAIAEAHRLHPDVVVMDIGMPELNGVDITRRLTAELPEVKIIALGMNHDRRYVTAMLTAGASGYLLKNAASDELLGALDVVMRGDTYVPPAITLPPTDPTPEASPPESLRPLSPREREVLKLVAEGKSSKEIAVALQIAVPTVETHRRQIADKLGLRTIAELTRYAIREGLIRDDI